MNQKPITVFLNERKVHRIIYGSLAYKLDLDYALPLPELKIQVEEALKQWLADGKHFSFLQHIKLYFSDGLHVYEGGHHIDVVALNKGSLNILHIEDHLV